MSWIKKRMVALALLLGGGALLVAGALFVLLPWLAGEHDRTELHTAAEHNDIGVIREWLAGGGAVDPEMQFQSTIEHAGDEGVTPLMLAARAGQVDAALALLDAGARPDAETRPSGYPQWPGTTVLEYAIEGGHPAIVDAVLSRAPAPAAKERQYRIAAAAARTVCDHPPPDVLPGEIDQRTARKAASAVMARGIPAELARAHLARAIETASCAELLQLALDHGVAPSPRMLVVASMHGDTALVQRLLAAGADPDAPAPLPYREEPLAPLHVAQDAQHFEVVDALLAGRANPDVRRPDGRTALHVALQSRAHESYALLDRLIAAGARVDIADSQGRTALDLARERLSPRVQYPLAPATLAALRVPAHLDAPAPVGSAATTKTD